MQGAVKVLISGALVGGLAALSPCVLVYSARRAAVWIEVEKRVVVQVDDDSMPFFFTGR